MTGWAGLRRYSTCIPLLWVVSWVRSVVQVFGVISLLFRLAMLNRSVQFLSIDFLASIGVLFVNPSLSFRLLSCTSSFFPV